MVVSSFLSTTSVVRIVFSIVKVKFADKKQRINHSTPIVGLNFINMTIFFSSMFYVSIQFKVFVHLHIGKLSKKKIKLSISQIERSKTKG